MKKTVLITICACIFFGGVTYIGYLSIFDKKSEVEVDPKNIKNIEDDGLLIDITNATV
ncbi:hypothetical protein [Chengkuizengella marina]|uniref:hypothetical protein n=1 Tax=Chengkuizengella marina TaxID=2507566 RepID=UPI00137032CF|nr:hypothetical protein [Chengkuizengella marina]